MNSNIILPKVVRQGVFKPGYIAYKDFDSGYYTVYKDVINYPGCAFYVAWSARGPGKTYSVLDMCVHEGLKFIYLKRTLDDVDTICAKSLGMPIEEDPSPFAPLNRDYGWNVEPVSIKKGEGVFVDMEQEGAKRPFGKIYSLSKVKSIKGMELSSYDVIILDEFIPQVHEIVRKKEADALLDLVRTVSRDRIARGKKPVMLFLFANSESIACPITAGLEIMDEMAEMAFNKESIRYLEDRGILLHYILPEEAPKMLATYEKDPLYKAMKGTKWQRKSYGGEFTNNDFSNIKVLNIKNMIPFIQISYNQHKYYIYYREDGQYYMCFNKAKCPRIFDLDKENDQKLFWAEECQSLRVDCMEGRFAFQKYSMYDLIINYKNYFIV